MEQLSERIMMDFLEVTELREKFNTLDANEIETLIRSQDPVKGYVPKEDDGLFYFNSSQRIIDQVKSFLPESIRELGEVSLCRVIGCAVPHKDHNCNSKINFYLRASDSRTVFFKDPGKPGLSYNNDGVYNIYSIKEHRLRSSSQFTANDGDVFILDTSMIHSVTVPEGKERFIVSVSFNLSFDELKDKLGKQVEEKN